MRLVKFHIRDDFRARFKRFRDRALKKLAILCRKRVHARATAPGAEFIPATPQRRAEILVDALR